MLGHCETLKEMATRKWTCSICDQRHEAREPVSWCPECEEALCLPCKQHHDIARSSRAHVTISIDDYQKLPSTILDIKLSCSEHNEPFIYYCLKHEKPLCKKCLAVSHKICPETPMLDDVIQNVKFSASFENIERSFKHILEKIRMIQKDRSSNLQTLQQQRKEIASRIKKMRSEVQSYFDKLEFDLLTELNQISRKNEESIQSLMKNLEEKEKIVSEIAEQQESIKKYASNFQTFVGLRELERISNTESHYLQTLSDDGKLDQVDITYSPEKKCTELFKSIKELGKIDIGTSANRMLMDVHGKEAQIPTSSFIPEILQPRKTIAFDRLVFAMGCCKLPNEDIIFLNSWNEDDGLIIYKPDGTVFIKSLPKESCNVVYIEGDRIAVSTKGDKSILILDILSYKVVTKINTQCHPRGMTYSKGKLIFIAEGEGLKTLDLSNFTITDLYTDSDVEFYSYITVGENRICYSGPETNTVTVLDSKCNTIFKFMDDALNFPEGVAMDEYLNIYVVGNLSSNLMFISSDGKESRQLVGPDVLNGPTAIHYDKIAKRLIISTSGSKAFEYDVRF